MPAFEALDDASVLRLARLGRAQRKPRYHVFYHEGGRADTLFVLLAGTVRLAAGRDSRARELQPPAAFGLEALAALAAGEEEEEGGGGDERGGGDHGGAPAAPPLEHRLEEAMASHAGALVVLLPSAVVRSALYELAATAAARGAAS